ncbi:MAG: PQQ-like beta-propeller repeat protein, partial [Peptococcaceae bacterium]|nr:PQQ-like beta-propeller repeat protein [Peptococcaceae bacterium]
MRKKTLCRATALGLALLLTLSVTGADNSLGALVPRFGIDQQNSRRINDALEDTGFPFQKVWATDLGGEVGSQPIVCDGRVYAQAGNKLARLDLAGRVQAVSPVLTDSPLPSGSSPTFANTLYGPRIYQATRDHRLWALDPDTLTPLWTATGGYLTISAGGSPEARYRVTTSPLVINDGGDTLIALGTANGDQTGLSGQYADNGFFILRDTGADCEVIYCRQGAGEVTGSPILMGDLIIGTQNILGGEDEEENLLICYDLRMREEVERSPRVSQAIPGSPAAQGNRLYLADRQGRVYCYEKTAAGDLERQWTAAPPGGGHYNLNSPAIGNRYVYLPLRQYQGGNGMLLAINKETGAVEKTLAFGSVLCSNILFWQPAGARQEFLLVYEASGRTQLLDGETLEPVSGFMDEAGAIHRDIMLPSAVTGLKAPEPLIGENYMLLVDGDGTMHAYIGR